LSEYEDILTNIPIEPCNGGGIQLEDPNKHASNTILSLLLTMSSLINLITISMSPSMQHITLYLGCTPSKPCPPQNLNTKHPCLAPRHSPPTKCRWIIHIVQTMHKKKVRFTLENINTTFSLHSILLHKQ